MPALNSRLTSCAIAALIAAGLWGARPAAAGKPPAGDAAGPRKGKAIPLVGDAVGPDDFALRYYASLKQTARVEAELARLRTLYPDYEPPADLYEAPASSVIDEQPFWVLFSADRIDELKEAIAARQKELPGWRPSADLASKLRRKEARLRITSFWKADKILDLVDYLGREDPGVLSDDADLLWMAAEAYARAKQNDDAVNMFKRVLASAKDPDLRVATIRKALGVLRMPDVEILLAAVPGALAWKDEYAPLVIDVTRARIAAFLHDARAEEVPPADVAKFEAYARDSRAADQLGLVAWYNYKRRDFNGALEWFKLAIENDGDAMIAHGLAHSLRALDRKREAEEVAYAWREPLVNNVILFLDLLETDLTREVPPFIEGGRLARYAKVTMETASGEGAQALAWYAYNSCQWDVALFWFERAVAWFPKDATVYGYALTLKRLKKDRSLYELANRYDGLFAKVVEILFPDSYHHPPTPCDRRDAAKLHGPGVKTAGFMAPGPALIPGAPPNYAKIMVDYAAQKNASDPFETAQDAEAAARALARLKGKFPAAVAMENPLRFHPAPLAPPPEAPLRKDPATAPAPLVARRVPGVGPMPYEKYGFSLLPGWNGQAAASWPPYSRQIAPPGTQWAEQDADPARGGLALFDARYPASARGLPPGAPPSPPPPPEPSRPPAYGQYPASRYPAAQYPTSSR